MPSQPSLLLMMPCLLANPAMSMDGDTTIFDVVVPRNAAGGSKIRITVPGTDGEKITIIVPEGAIPGAVVSFPLSRAWIRRKRQQRAVIKLQAVSRGRKARETAAEALAARDAANALAQLNTIAAPAVERQTPAHAATRLRSQASGVRYGLLWRTVAYPYGSRCRVA
jgi:hypothetical protein